jgi:hypothetical protein
MEADPAFGSGTSRAAVARDLAVDAASESASHNGLDFRPVNGSGREFRTLTDGVDRRYRLRRARRETDGSLTIASNSDSALVVADYMLIPEEPWVLGYTYATGYQIEHVFVAPVLGIQEGRPGRLILGRITQLLTAMSPGGGGFLPVEEELEGFGDEAGSGDDTGLV